MCKGWGDLALESIPLTSTSYMLDTNCFDQILDGDLSLCIPSSMTLVCTGVQRDELSRCTPPDRREALLKIFENINPNIVLASSFCFGIEGAGFDQACWNDGTGRFHRMLERLKDSDRARKKRPKDLRNQIRDIVIAETALTGRLTLVTNDEGLANVMIEFGGKAINFKEFTARGDTI